MLYFDYAANTPVDAEVLSVFIDETKKIYGNANSHHQCGREANQHMVEMTKEIAKLLSVKPNEIIYTSGASESNNLAIKGVAKINRNQGKHIVSTYLEHSSVSAALTALQNDGYEIDLVDIERNGRVDLEHLEELIRKDTVLVSVCYVDSELGVVQPIKEIAELVKKFPNCRLHVDATQAIGKIPVDLEGIDLCSFAPHKFFGLNGCGVLVRKEDTIIEPMIHGGVSTTMYRSGTPAPGMTASILMALKKALKEQPSRYERVKACNEKIRKALEQYPLVRINSPEEAMPFILNASVKGIKAGVFQEALDKHGVCISTKSACSVPNTPSRPVFAVSRDKKNAMSSWRLSFSHLTTDEEVEQFLKIFDTCYNELTNEQATDRRR